jgi:hypothetical protein
MKYSLRLAVIIAIALAVVSLTVVRADSLSTKTSEAYPASVDRKVLWESFLRDCPPQYLPVEVYAENDTLTVICYRSELKTLLYSLKDRKVSEAQHAKAVGEVNRISYEAEERSFVLWHNGIEQMKVGNSF